MVIFHSFVSLPEGNGLYTCDLTSWHWKHGECWGIIPDGSRISGYWNTHHWPRYDCFFWEGLMQLGDHAIVYGVTWGYFLHMGMIRYSTAQVRPMDPIFPPVNSKWNAPLFENMVALNSRSYLNLPPDNNTAGVPRRNQVEIQLFWPDPNEQWSKHWLMPQCRGLYYLVC